MKKNFLLASMAVAAIVACSDQIADSPPVVTPAPQEPQEIPIDFGSNSRGITRAEFTGADAAEMLDYQFVVSGYKGASTASAGDVVFDNYAVQYKENSAHTTESNTRNWEYVGIDRIKHAIDNGITRQSVKYWDYSQDQYDFIAWSTGKATAIYEGTPAAGEVLVSAITPQTAVGDAKTDGDVKAYTFRGRAADLNNCYISDIVTVKKADYATYENENPVTLRFRSLGSKVRIGFYETVPGYSVRDVEFYSAAASDDAQATTPKLFTATANDIFSEGTYTVYFPTVDDESDADNNQAHVKFDGIGTQSSVVEFGGLHYTIAEEGEKTAGSVFLGRSSNTATFAGEAEGNYYTQYLPNETGANLNLRINFTLESIDGSGETIVVKGASAQVPSIYTQWKPGFAYTYLFKISDRTNGHTGTYDPTKPDDTTVNSDPVGLYPITFDAVVVNTEEEGIQETITTISTPSITTYQTGSTVVDNNEYLASTGDIFVTVNENDNMVTFDENNVALFTLSNNRAYSESDVVDAMSIKYADSDDAINGRNGLTMTKAPFSLVNRVEYGVDGNIIALADKQALRFTPSAGTYAFVYTQTAPTGDASVVLQVVDVELGTSASGYYRYNYLSGSGDVQKGQVYFSTARGLKDVFLGQGVSTLYVNTGNASAPVYTTASGYAATGVTYYYTVDGGQSYKAAVNIAYADFASAELYTYNGTDYVAKTDSEPVDGTAYYQKQTNGTYTYCVILPEQADGLKVLDTTQKIACAANERTIAGQTYFVPYYKNNGVYYTKVIKVQ